MNIKKIVTKTYQENVYVYYDEASKVGAVIDPGSDAKDIIKFLDETGLKIEYILLTHGHFDHIMAVKEVAAHTGAPVAAGVDERELLGSGTLNFAMEVYGTDYGVSVDVPLKDGDVLNVGGARIKVLHTPGHTKGGVCFYDEAEGVLFSGDTLFHESIGRTDFPGGNMNTLDASIKSKIYTLPPQTLIYPGHMRMTTVEHEIKNNPFVNLASSKA
ncbi:MAG: MBL fold metallo-hydrolase [Defluviitaleaceae bacterium]|nr:MBL fold metallo-hydrolase [Defluviitaleaceae bacterium]